MQRLLETCALSMKIICGPQESHDPFKWTKFLIRCVLYLKHYCTVLIFFTNKSIIAESCLRTGAIRPASCLYCIQYISLAF